MMSKTRIKGRERMKTNSRLVETLILARKNEKWLPVARLLSSPNRNTSVINLKDLDKKTKAGDTVVVPGKILASGNMTKKIRLCALNLSESAREKLKENKSEFVEIIDEIKKNPKAEGITILR